MMGSGREVRRKKILRKRKRKGEAASWTGGQRDKGWEREWGRERKAEKNSKRKQGTMTARKKGRGTGIWTEMEKKAAGTKETRQEEQQGAGQRRKDRDSSRMEMEKKHREWSTGQKGIGIWAGSGTKGQSEKQRNRKQDRATDQINDDEKERKDRP